jgi:antitoxin ParD1/3/4
MQAAEKLSITLPAEMVRVIRDKVESGGYSSNSEVIREAMRGWLERERHFARLDAAIDRGISDIEAGHFMTSDDLRKSLLDRLSTASENPDP